MNYYRLALTLLVTMSCARLAVAQTPQSVTKPPAGSTQPRTGFAVSPIPQKDCPFKLVETTHGIPDLLRSGRIENDGTKTVLSYKIGWLMIFRDPSRKIESTVGKIMNVPAGVKPGETTLVPGQALDRSNVPEGTGLIGFFVADVEYADGTHFVEDIDRIAQEAAKDISQLQPTLLIIK